MLRLEGAVLLALLVTNLTLIRFACGQNITGVAPAGDLHDEEECRCTCICEPTIIIGDELDAFCTYGTESCNKKIDLVFILDGSGSVGEENFVKMLIAISNLARTFNIDIDTGMQVGFIVYSDKVWQQFNLNQFQDPEILAAAIRALRYPTGGTRTDLALEGAETIFANSGRIDAYRIALLITDGRSEQPLKTFDAAQFLRMRQDVILATFGITENIRRGELGAIVSEPDLAFFTDTFDEFVDSLNARTDEVCIKLGKPALTYKDQRTIDVEWIDGINDCIEPGSDSHGGSGSATTANPREGPAIG